MGLYTGTLPYVSNNTKNKCLAVAEMGDRFATIDRPKIGGGAVPPFWGAS